MGCLVNYYFLTISSDINLYKYLKYQYFRLSEYAFTFNIGVQIAELFNFIVKRLMWPCDIDLLTFRPHLLHEFCMAYCRQFLKVWAKSNNFIKQKETETENFHLFSMKNIGRIFFRVGRSYEL